ATGVANLLIQYGMFSNLVYIMSPYGERKQGWLPGTITEKSSVLMMLLEADGKVVSRDTLLTRVWGEFYDESRTLDVHIRKLRMKLESAGDLIHTVKNIGYKLGGNENG
ncbi:MAG: winged helix-turn-helix domain-containing protein, partial [Ruminococcaceae bacterium]|nr:winged helix-turn-helix domain-containing protein [Oscillospiraceae bacterium]